MRTRIALRIRKTYSADMSIQSVKLFEQAVAEMNRKLLNAASEAYKERNEGLEADWTDIAFQLESIRELADHAASHAWRIVAEQEDEYASTQAGAA